MEISLTGEALDFGSKDYGSESHISNILINKKNPLFDNHVKSLTNSTRNYINNSINQRNVMKSISIYIKTNKWVLFFFTIFKKEGMVLYFKFMKNNLLLVRFSYVHYVTFWKKIKFFFKNRYAFNLSYKALCYFNRNSYAILYLSTPSGVISTAELLKYKQGGQLLFALYN